MGMDDNDRCSIFAAMGEIAAPTLFVENDHEKLAALSPEERAEHDAQMKRIVNAIKAFTPDCE